MYQWKTLRAFAVVLLCLPLVHVTYLIARDVTAYLDPSPAAWASELERIIALDLQTSLPEHPVLVVGGQRVRLWRDLPARLAPLPTLMRPLGDATLEDITHYYDRLVAYYRPRVLVIVPSYADLHVRDSKSPDDLRDAARTLLELDAGYGTTDWRVLLVPLMTPLHPEDDEPIRAMSRLAKALEGELPRLTVVDPNRLLTDTRGRPNPAFYRSDGINLNDEGYARASLALVQALADLPLDPGQGDKGN